MRAVHSTACPRVTTEKRVIAGFAATLSRLDVGGDAIALWEVAHLERHVDRHALLAADDPPEPPYWAHRWTGATVLADAVPRGARSTDALRIDTRDFYATLDTLPLTWRVVERPMREEGLPVMVRLVEIARR